MPLRVRLEEGKKEGAGQRHRHPAEEGTCVLVVEQAPVALDAAKLDPLPFLIGEL